LAILRALGAKRRTIFGAVLAEAACIGVIGSIAGFAVYFVLFAGVAKVIRAQTGVVLDLGAWHPVLWWCPLAMIGLCALGGIVPALKAYRTPVAETLAPVS
jgi:putative ABC transport system permease protein